MLAKRLTNIGSRKVMKKVYPVIFTITETNVLVEVPDMGIFTEGTDLENDIEKARDAIGLNGIVMQDDGENVPEPSNLEDINVRAGAFAGDGKGLVSLVDIDADVYRRKVITRRSGEMLRCRAG